MRPWDHSRTDYNIKDESKKENLDALVATAYNYDNSHISVVDYNSLIKWTIYLA